VVTRSEDEFHNVRLGSSLAVHDGSYYNLSLPAAWYYPQMGQKSADDDRTNELGTMAGQITSYGAEGNPTLPGWFTDPKGVVSANAQTFSSGWFDKDNNPNTNQGNPATDHNIASILSENSLDVNTSAQYAKLSQLNGRLRPHRSYIYKGEITESDNATGARITNGGLQNTFNMFNPQSPGQGWVNVNTVMAYDPNGNPLLEKDILDIYSTARFGYKKQLPVLVAKNAAYSTVQFYDYEEKTDYSSALTINSSNAHSGKSSLTYSNGIALFKNVLLNSQLMSKGASVKLWLKSDKTNEGSNLQVLINGGTTPCTKIAQNGEWVLYEARVTGTGWGSTTLNQRFDVILSYSLIAGENVFVDDARFQPMDAQMITYVYDAPSKRLVAQFDDQHFGMYYQYNDEGKLVRKMKETERGMMTLHETQYNLPKTAR
jgi:hypothetical protein